MRKMNLKSIFSWLYGTTIDRAREDRAMNHSVYRPVSVSYVARISLVLLMVALFGVNVESWGYDWYARVGVSQGKGTAYIEIYNNALTSKKVTKTSATTSGSVVYCKESVTLGSTEGWPICHASSDDGYSFEGWYYNSVKVSTNADYNTHNEDGVTLKKGWDRTYYAKFTPNSYDVVLAPNGGSGSNQTICATYDSGMPTTLKGGGAIVAPTKTGYEFAGYYDAASGGTKYYNANLTSAHTWNKASTGVTLYAHWTAITYTITLTAGAGTTSAGTTSITATYDASTNLTSAITTPTKDKNVFDGYYTGTNGSGTQIIDAFGNIIANAGGGSTYTDANKKWKYAGNIELYANWISKYDFEITGGNYTINNDAWSKTEAFTFVHADEAHMTTTIQKPDVISYDRSSNTITALKIGTSKITFTQNTSTTVNNGTIEYTITVDSVANTLAVSGTSFTKYVDQEVTSVRSNQNSNGTITTTSSNPNLAHYDIANNKIVIPNSNAQKLPFDDVTITISQAATAKYKAKKHTIILTVEKYANTIKVKGVANYSSSIYVDSYDNGLTLTADNTDYATYPITNTQTAGQDIATYYQESNVVYSSYKLGTATWTLSQPENYKYQAGSGSFTVNVVNAAEATDCYVLSNQSKQEKEWHGNTCHEHTWDDENAAGVVHFEISKDGGIDQGYKVQQKIGNNWVDVTDYKNDHSTSWGDWKTQTLNRTAKGVRFMLKGGSYNYVRNVSVTRATYLEASNVTINRTAGGTPIYPSDGTGVGTLTINYSLANGGDLKITNDNPEKFSLSKTTISDVDCKTGTENISVSYTSDEAGTHYAHLVIYNQTYRKEVTLTGVTIKAQPTVTWSSDADYFNVEEVLSATNANGLTVTLYSEGNEDYVSCDGNEATMLQATDGTITITAHVTGNEFYADRDITKIITITNKTKQYITWNQNPDLSRLKTTDGTKSITLNATASSGLPVSYELVGDKTGLSLTQNGETWTLTFSSECKNTTIVASQAGNSTYAPASSYSQPVKVIDPTKVCDMNETLVNSTVTLKENSTTYNIDIPNKMYVSVSRTKTGTFDWYLVGIDFEFYSGRNGTGTKLYTKSYGAGDIDKSISNSEINLSSYIHAKSVKVVTTSSNGYNINSITYTHQKYCNISTNSLDFSTSPNTQTAALNFNVEYANYPISLECSNNKFTVTPTEFGDCSEYGTQQVSVSYTAGTEEGEDVGYIYVKDNTGTTLRTCTLNVEIRKVPQSIRSHNIAMSYNTTDRVTLSAEANSGLTDFTYSATPSGIAVFNGSEMTFVNSGTIAITITQPGNDVYASTSTTVQNVVVSKVTPVLTAPTAANEITYGASLSTLNLAGGSAARQDETDIPGTYAWQDGTQVLSAGTHNDVVVLFTPDDGTIYNTNTATISVTVNKKDLTVTADDKAVTYGDAAPEYTASYDGFIEGESAANLGGELAFACEYTAESNVGTYTITPSGLTSDNYDITFTAGILTVSRPEVVITDPETDLSGLDATTEVTVSANITIDEPIEVYSLEIADNTTVTIAATGGLNLGVGGLSKGENAKLVMEAVTEGANKGETGYIRVSPDYEGEMPQAEIEMFSVGYYNRATGDAKWQYVGVPVDMDGALAKTVFTGSYIYSWSETTGSWVNNRASLVMAPFTGYATTQTTNASGVKLTYSGALIDGRDPIVVPLTYTSTSAEPGCNVLANSFAAPIDISRLQASDFSEGVEATIYLFNTGSDEDIASRNQKSVDVSAPGQYIGVTPGTAVELHRDFSYPIVIPSMQGFYVQTNKAGTLTLDYERLVWNADYSQHGNAPLRKAAKDSGEEDLTEALQVTIQAVNGADNLFMLGSDEYAPEYENGFDARKKMSDDTSLPSIFAVEGSDHLSIDATSRLEGTHIGVRTGSETMYTLVFSHLRSGDELILRDTEEETTVEIAEGAEYTFFAAPNTLFTSRFIIERSNASEKPSITTAVDQTQAESGVTEVYNIEGKRLGESVPDAAGVYIIRHGKKVIKVVR